MNILEKIRVEKLNQLVNKNIYFGKLNIVQLKEIIKYTNRKPIAIDPFENNHQPQIDEDNLHYQRVKSSERAYDIKLFFLKNISNKFNYRKNRISPLGTFPSSIIISLKTNDDINDYLSYIKYLEDKEENLKEFSFYKEDEGILLIPKTKQALIVDGQHRVAGLELLLDEINELDIKLKKTNLSEFQFLKNNFPSFNFIETSVLEFEFLVTFLIDFDPYEQAEIFATVNFNQIKVNKSFYYDIFGSSTRGKSVEKLLHDIVSHLNYKSGSPLENKIKMLGTGPGYISQSFFVDAFLPHFKNGVFTFVFSDFLNNGIKYQLIPNFIKIYFETIFELYSDFLPNNDDKKYPFVLLKTTGMGALIKLMPNVFNKIKEDNGFKNSFEVLEMNEIRVRESILMIFNDVKSKGEKYFGSESIFSQGAGKGMQNRLYNLIYNDIGFKNTQFLDNLSLF